MELWKEIEQAHLDVGSRCGVDVGSGLQCCNLEKGI
jgi:hypothetical protein